MKKIFKTTLSLILCLTMLTGIVVSARAVQTTASGVREYTRFADLRELEKTYLSYSKERSVQYPNGGMMLAETSGELSMGMIYAIDIFRIGGTKGKASIKLSTIDMTAGYGEAYRMYLSNKLSDEGVEGSKKLYYYNTGLPYIARQETQRTVLMTQDDEAEALKDASEINDLSSESMPKSSETVLSFADGENRKTVYIETYQTDEVTDDLEFMLTLSQPENCAITPATSGIYTIKETREKPKATVEIASTSVNPDDAEAYVTVTRKGNLGGYDSFRLTTKSDTAKADEDYIAVAEDLRFMPNVSQLKVPVTLLDGASDGERFSVELSDPSGNISIKKDTATVTFNKDTDLAPTGGESTFAVSDGTFKSSSYRDCEFVDLSKFHKESSINGSWKEYATYSYKDNKLTLAWSQGKATCSAIDAMSYAKLDMTGIKNVHVCEDSMFGSCVWDYGAVVFNNTNPLDDGDRNCDWMDTLPSNRGKVWDLGDYTKDHKTYDFTPDTSKSCYVYLVLRKGRCGGTATVRFHNYAGNKDCAMRLDLVKYHLNIVDPDPIKIFENGSLADEHVVTNVQFTDPNSASANYTTSADFYRYDTVTIKGSIDQKYGSATLVGIRLKGGDGNYSDVIPISGGNVCFDPSFLSTYGNYLDKNNNLTIKPEYTYDQVNLTVQSYEDTKTGVKFVADNDNHRGTFTVGGRDYGTVTWDYDSSRPYYCSGDTIRFTYTPGEAGVNNSVAYEYRFADVESDLASAQWYKTSTGTNTIPVTLSDRYFSVSPYIIDQTVETRLMVTNPDCGDFTGKGTKYASSDGSKTIVTGYYIEGKDAASTLDKSFDQYAAGERLDFTATPANGYYAEWTYTDAATHQEVTYRGNSFYYIVQNPFSVLDNTISLTFRQRTLDYSLVSIPVHGSISMPQGSILHPATANTTITVPAAGAIIYMDGYVAKADDGGNFTFKENTTDDNPADAKITMLSDNAAMVVHSIDETHRALVLYNGNFYIADVLLQTIVTGDSIGVDITIDSSSNLGVIPTRVVATSKDTGTYGDTITLVNARTVTFKVDFDARNVDKKVNLTKWSFVGENGMLRKTTDVSVDDGNSYAVLNSVVAEDAKQGDRLFVEFYNRSYSSSADEVLTYYGKFEVGYQFQNANIETSVSYMPDIGYYDEDPDNDGDLAATGAKYGKVPEAPGIGPLSPMVSLFGFLPSYSDSATGQKDKDTGKDLYTLEIGIQLEIGRTMSTDGTSKWDIASLKEQWKSLSDTLTKSPGEMIQNMHTSVSISVTISFTYQLEYYKADNGDRHYTESVFVIGGKLGVKVSIPFSIVGIPCFAYFEISADNVGYIVNTPSSDTPGYWTSDTVSNSNNSDTHGRFTQDFKIEVGLGVGFDGLAAIGGHMDVDLISELDGLSDGKMTLSLSGGIFAQLIFFKVDQTWNIHDWTLLDSSKDVASVAQNLLNEKSKSLMDTKLCDMKLAEASEQRDTNINNGVDIAETGAAQAINELYAEENSAQSQPVIARISDTRYLIATMMSDNDNKFVLHTYTYDEKNKTITNNGSPVNAMANRFSANAEESQKLADCSDLVTNVDLIDCGDKLLMVWVASTADDYLGENTDDALNSMKLAAMTFDKETEQFEDYHVLDLPQHTVPNQVKGVYNADSKKAHIVFEGLDSTGMTDQSTLAEWNDCPVSLYSCTLDMSADNRAFTPPERVDTNGNTVTGFDVSAYDGGFLLSYICAEENSLILETPLTDTEYNNADYGTQNLMYLNRYSDEGEKPVQASSIMIADEDRVTANPQFAQVNYGGVTNTLLFFKCNGRYGYQNIENLYIQYQHNGNQLSGDQMNPQFITNDNDHTTGSDFKVYPGDGTIFALWTLSQGNQQQIWGRQLIFDENSIEYFDETAVVDENGQVRYDGDQPVMSALPGKISILHGTWGNKAQLTSGGSMNDPSTGLYKSNFDALIFGPDRLISAYNSYDLDYGTEEYGDTITAVNNRFVVSEFNIGSSYSVDDFSNALEVSDLTPNPGDVVDVTAKATNDGFSTGRDVSLKLFGSGAIGEIGSVDYPIWCAEDEKTASFKFTVPEGVEANKISLWYEIFEDGKSMFKSESLSFKSDPDLVIRVAHAKPVQHLTEDDDTTNYHVCATIYNYGNKLYPGGGELNFVHNDIAAQADVMNDKVAHDDPFYRNFGGVAIPAIGVGESVTLSFVSDDIPAAIYDKYGTSSANLKVAITPKDGVGWKEIKGEDRYRFLDELGIGQMVKPVPDEVKDITLEEVEVPLGSTRFIMPRVMPETASATAEFSYASSDTGILKIDENGMMIGVKTGKATVTVTCGEIRKTVEITVGKPEKGDADLDGDVTIIDATMIQRFLVDLEKLGDEALKQADADGDGDVTILDATYIQRYLVGIIAHL